MIILIIITISGQNFNEGQINANVNIKPSINSNYYYNNSNDFKRNLESPFEALRTSLEIQICFYIEKVIKFKNFMNSSNNINKIMHALNGNIVITDVNILLKNNKDKEMVVVETNVSKIVAQEIEVEVAEKREARPSVWDDPVAVELKETIIKTAKELKVIDPDIKETAMNDLYHQVEKNLYFGEQLLELYIALDNAKGTPYNNMGEDIRIFGLLNKVRKYKFVPKTTVSKNIILERKKKRKVNAKTTEVVSSIMVEIKPKPDYKKMRKRIVKQSDSYINDAYKKLVRYLMFKKVQNIKDGSLTVGRIYYKFIKYSLLGEIKLSANPKSLKFLYKLLYDKVKTFEVIDLDAAGEVDESTIAVNKSIFELILEIRSAYKPELKNVKFMLNRLKRPRPEPYMYKHE